MTARPEPEPAAGVVPAAPALRLGAWEGPLDRLLEGVRAQRVDLAGLSVAALAEQVEASLAGAIARRAVPLPLLAEWLVMAAWLTALRARLLVPDPPGEETGAAPTDPQQRLAEREAARRLADWLERRPQLGREVFARGAPDPMLQAAPAAELTELLRACLKLLALPVRGERRDRPGPLPLWRASEALAHLRALLPCLSADGVPLARLVPTGDARMRTALQRRAALASTFLAGLELEREGALALGQRVAFGEIRVGQQ